MEYLTKKFLKRHLYVKNQQIGYYISPLLKNFKFNHAFFTKLSSEFDLEQLSKCFNEVKINYFNNQIHSNFVILGSKSNLNKKIKADGILSDKSNQNIWIYSADCMPIFLADKENRLISALHCGRLGLEKKIINNVINMMDKNGSDKKNIVVAIGPSISRQNYLVDENCFINFFKNANTDLPFDYKEQLEKNNSKNLTNKLNLDLRKYAYKQLIDNKILPENIDISDLCTYELKDEFYSWRREKINKRNWNFISSKYN